ncbi:hypothetical protein PTKIN_Ptkin04bG0109000 [Pterospermum kingtungense]
MEDMMKTLGLLIDTSAADIQNISFDLCLVGRFVTNRSINFNVMRNHLMSVGQRAMVLRPSHADLASTSICCLGGERWLCSKNSKDDDDRMSIDGAEQVREVNANPNLATVDMHGKLENVVILHGKKDVINAGVKSDYKAKLVVVLGQTSYYIGEESDLDINDDRRKRRLITSVEACDDVLANKKPSDIKQ